jgi:hypothetical protein
MNRFSFRFCPPTFRQCNNPKTKEAKLTAAARIIPEWQSYDDEIKALQDRVAKGHGHAAAAKKAAHGGDRTKHVDLSEHLRFMSNLL